MASFDKLTPISPPQLDAAGFARAFPFFVQIDQQLRIVRVGRSMQKVVGSLGEYVHLHDVFQMISPLVLDRYEDVWNHAGDMLTLVSRTSKTITFRGCPEISQDGTLLLLLTPVLQSLTEQGDAGLSFADFAKHDAAADALLLAQIARMSALDAERIATRLRQRGEQLGSILELGNHGVMFFDSEQSILHVNSALLDMLGLSRADAFDMRLAQMDTLLQELSDKTAGECPSLIALREAPGPDQLHATLHLVRPRTRIIRLDCACSADGGTVYYLRDITHETEVDRMKSEFLAAAAHELRTPMVSIVGFTELLLNRKFSEERRTEMLQTILRQSGLLVKMINELLDLARIESRRGLDLQIQAQPLRDLIDSSVKGLMRTDTDRQVHVAEVPDLSVLIDTEKMQLGISNLLSNAFKYSPQGGPVTLTARLDNRGSQSFAAIEIRDQGIGMSPDQLERAFDRFYRADASGNIPGSGLGLSMVKEIAELHGGKVELTSAIGAGTVATFWIPLAKGSIS